MSLTAASQNGSDAILAEEAEQISLRRRVALKVLPFVATMDARHLQRFHNEARPFRRLTG